MALNPTYSVGTISVSAGGTIVTGAGTLWMAGEVRAGDRVMVIGVGGIGNIHSRANDVGWRAAERGECFGDDRQAARSLHPRVADRRRTVGFDRRAARDVDAIADPDCAAVAVHGFKG